MFCLYTLPLARPAQAKIQMLTTSSRIVTILLKSLGVYLKKSKNGTQEKRTMLTTSSRIVTILLKSSGVYPKKSKNDTQDKRTNFFMGLCF